MITLFAGCLVFGLRAGCWCLGGLVVGCDLVVLSLLVVRLAGDFCGDFQLGLLLLIVLVYLIVDFDSFI